MFNHTLKKFAAVLALSASLVAVGANASQAGSPPKPLIGGILGGVVGAGAGLALGKEQGAVLGGIMGAALGAIVADRLDSHDRHGDRAYDGYIPPAPAYEPAVYQPTYQPGPSYPVYQGPVYQNVEYQQPSPYPAYSQADGGQYCRPFNANVAVDGQKMVSQGTACLQPDGTWKLLN